jgi:F-type H+-transporting ATPase subunit b
MHIDLWTLGLQAINALVLIWLLARFLFRPVAGIIAQRRQAAEAMLAEAAAARARAQATEQEVAQQRQALTEEANRIRAAAHTDAEADRNAISAQARAEAAEARREVEADLERTRARQEKELRDRAGVLAVDIARRLLARMPERTMIEAFVERLGRDLTALQPGQRQALADDAGTLAVTTATPLDPKAKETVAAVLARSVGTRPELAFRVDPGLLAGIELNGRHVQLRNSWRADLERLQDDLTSERANAL